MSNNLEDLYNQVYEKIKPKIKSLEIGILYQAIQIILLEDEPNTKQIKTLIICDHFNIKRNAYRYEDINLAYSLRDIFSYTTISETDYEDINLAYNLKDILSHLTSEIDIKRETVKLVKIVKDKLLNDKSGDKKMEELKWIVIVACTVVGAYICIQYLKEQENKKNKNQLVKNYTREELETTSRQRLLVPAALCLIVPANIVGKLTNGSSINIDDLSYLIDSASDFICAAKADADSIEQQMSMTDKIPSDSIREVYIRINLADGRNLIGKKILYMIKTNLPIDTDFFVKKVACLQNLNGLKFFNHV